MSAARRSERALVVLSPRPTCGHAHPHPSASSVILSSHRSPAVPPSALPLSKEGSAYELISSPSLPGSFFYENSNHGHKREEERTVEAELASVIKGQAMRKGEAEWQHMLVGPRKGLVLKSECLQNCCGIWDNTNGKGEAVSCSPKFTSFWNLRM